MLKGLLCLMILASLQVDSSSFYVQRVEAITEYDSYYILDLAYVILPPDQLRRNSDVDCLVNELKASGLFEDVHAELLKTGERDTRSLKIDTVYRSKIKNFVVTEITLSGFAEVDQIRFQSALNERGIKTGMLFLEYPFSRLRDRIGEALGAVSPKRIGYHDSTFWITIRPAGIRNLKLIISPTYSGCGVETK